MSDRTPGSRPIRQPRYIDAQGYGWVPGAHLHYSRIFREPYEAEAFRSEMLQKGVRLEMVAEIYDQRDPRPCDIRVHVPLNDEASLKALDRHFNPTLLDRLKTSVVNRFKGFKLSGLFSLATIPVATPADLSEATRVFNSVADEFKLGLSRQATGEFTDVYAVAKATERLGRDLDIKEVEQAKQLAFNGFIEWGKKYSVPLEAMVRLNPTSATPDNIERSMNNNQGILAQSEALEPNLHVAQAQADRITRPQGMAMAAETAVNPALRIQPQEPEAPRLG